jgi:hypothetical protein
MRWKHALSVVVLFSFAELMSFPFVMINFEAIPAFITTIYVMATLFALPIFLVSLIIETNKAPIEAKSSMYKELQELVGGKVETTRIERKDGTVEKARIERKDGDVSESRRRSMSLADYTKDVFEDGDE